MLNHLINRDNLKQIRKAVKYLLTINNFFRAKSTKKNFKNKNFRKIIKS